jgi:hypothetical protein
MEGGVRDGIKVRLNTARGHVLQEVVLRPSDSKLVKRKNICQRYIKRVSGMAQSPMSRYIDTYYFP